ncbi:MAG: hypothetical protein AAFQ42_09115 [Pseudomonadota bacterium]
MASAHPPGNGNFGRVPSIGSSGRFGSCCAELNDILTSDDFNATFEIEPESGLLFMAVGQAELEPEGDEEPEIAWFDQPVRFCPFCGTEIQTAEEIDDKLGDLVEEGEA